MLSFHPGSAGPHPSTVLFASFGAFSTVGPFLGSTLFSRFGFPAVVHPRNLKMGCRSSFFPLRYSDAKSPPSLPCGRGRFFTTTVFEVLAPGLNHGFFWVPRLLEPSLCSSSPGVGAFGYPQVLVLGRSGAGAFSSFLMLVRASFPGRIAWPVPTFFLPAYRCVLAGSPWDFFPFFPIALPSPFLLTFL